MKKVNLDPSKLLGFRLYTETDTDAKRTAGMGAKVGVKNPARMGAKIGQTKRS